MGTSTHEKLIRTIEVANELEKNIQNLVFFLGDDRESTKKSNYLVNFFRQFQRESLIQENSKFPGTPYEFLELLQKPIKDWGFFNLQDLEQQKIDTDLIILSQTSGVTQEANNLLHEFNSSEEIEAEVILQVLKYCRKHIVTDPSMQEKYVLFRTYLIRNPLVEAKHRNRSINKIFGRDGSFFIEMLHECYENIIGSYKRICPHCGWTLKIKEGEKSCLSRDCIESYQSNTGLDEKYAFNERKHKRRTLEIIQRTTVIPGLQELKLAELLQQNKFEIVLYPNLEADGDIQILPFANSKQVINIDVKNYSSPIALARKLLRDSDKSNLKDCIIAVPSDKGSNSYINLTMRYLSDRGLEGVTIKRFQTIIDELKSIRKEKKDVSDIFA